VAYKKGETYLFPSSYVLCLEYKRTYVYHQFCLQIFISHVFCVIYMFQLKEVVLASTECLLFSHFLYSLLISIDTASSHE
jgi:hypothetical protein